MKRIIVALLMMLVLIASTAALAEREVTVLPEIPAEKEAEVFAERNVLNANDETVTPMPWQGYLEMNVAVGETTRTAKIYIPKNLPVGSLAVTMNVPDGVTDTFDFLEKSGWIERAEKERIWLIASEPVDGQWGTVEEEREYLTAVFKAHRAQKYFRGNLSMYVVGYGEMGTVLQQLVMADPLYTAAAVFMDASEIDTEIVDAYFAKSMNTEDRVYNVDYKDVPVPMWISNETVTEKNQAVAAYWKKVASVGETAEADETYGEVYTQAKESFFTPEGNIVKVAVANAAHDYAAPETTNAIADFLLQFFRTGAGGPWGNMITKKINYDEMGVEVKAFTDANGIARQYLVYVPENLRGSTEPLPVVFKFHGIKESARNAFEQSMWYKIADEKGFMVVIPESRLGGKLIAWDMTKNDIDYVNELLDRVVAEYPVDESRMYFSGHSMGIMLANYTLTTSLADRFAAIGGTSSGLMGEPYAGDNTTPLPYFISVGEYDTVGSYKLDAESMITAGVDYWLIRDGLATAENVADVRVNGMTETFVNGRNHNCVWKNEAGVPVVRFAWVEGKDHMNTYGENCILWDEWFSHWTIGEDGVRLYDGQPIK